MANNNIVNRWKEQDRLQDERGQMEYKAKLYRELTTLNETFLNTLKEEDEIERILSENAEADKEHIYLFVTAGEAEFSDRNFTKEDNKKILQIMLRACDERKDKINKQIGEIKEELKDYE